MSETDKVVGIRSTLPAPDNACSTQKVARGLRKLAEKIENGELGSVEYGLVSLGLGAVDTPPMFFGLADMRRDSAIGLFLMGAQALATDDLERT